MHEGIENDKKMPQEDSMRIIRSTLLTSLALGLAGPALAGPRCHAPLAEWQPRQALEDKLKAEGWQIRRIKTDDGCYRVYGTRGDGKRVKATFAPDTLTLIRERTRDDD